MAVAEAEAEEAATLKAVCAPSQRGHAASSTNGATEAKGLPVPGLRGLSERVVAVESVQFVLEMLLTIKTQMGRCLSPADREVCGAYFLAVGGAAEQLRWFVYRYMGHVFGLDARKMVEECKWDLKALSEDCNEYTNVLVERFQQLWAGLEEVSMAGSVSTPVRDMLWEAAITVVMESLVDGVSRVKKCSTEGRALMCMDLMALHSALSCIHPTAQPTRGKMYADSYIKAFYYDEKDVLAWIRGNYEQYHLRQMQGLVVYGVGVSMRKRRVKDLVAEVGKLYNTDGDDSDGGGET